MSVVWIARIAVEQWTKHEMGSGVHSLVLVLGMATGFRGVGLGCCEVCSLAQHEVYSRRSMPLNLAEE